jgi:hypothetical protein
VSPTDSNPDTNRRPLGILGRCAILALSVSLFSPLVAWYAWQSHGTTGVWAAAVAACVCWLGATIALVSTSRVRGPLTGMYALFYGMLFQAGLPFVAGLILSQSHGALARAGVFNLIVVYYLFTLLVKTWLVLPMVQAQVAASKTSSMTGAG